jgi:hypothetical protein
VKQVVLFLILLFGVTWSVGFWLAAQPGPTSLSGFLAAFLPQVWAPTVIALTLVGHHTAHTAFELKSLSA